MLLATRASIYEPNLWHEAAVENFSTSSLDLSNMLGRAHWPMLRWLGVRMVAFTRFNTMKDLTCGVGNWRANLVSTVFNNNKSTDGYLTFWDDCTCSE